MKRVLKFLAEKKFFQFLAALMALVSIKFLKAKWWVTDKIWRD